MRRFIIFIIGTAALFLLFFFNPENYPFPKCPFLLLTGWECPGCGSQRAIHALLHFNIPAALQYNALLVLSLPYIGILVISGLLKKKSHFFARSHQFIHNPRITYCYLSIVVIFTIIRNLV